MMDQNALHRSVTEAIRRWARNYNEGKCAEIKGEDARNYATRTELATVIVARIERDEKRAAKMTKSDHGI
jgi:hypothetical protein